MTDDVPEDVDAIVASLRQDPVLVSEMMGNGATAELAAALRAKADDAQVPVFVVLTRTPAGLSGTSIDEQLVSLVHAGLDDAGADADGLYYVHTSQGYGHFEAYGDLDPSATNDPTLYSLARFNAADAVDAALEERWGTTREVSAAAEAGIVLDVAGLPPIPDYEEPVLSDDQVAPYTDAPWTAVGYTYYDRPGDDTEPVTPGLGALVGVTVGLCVAVLAYRLLRTTAGFGQARRDRASGVVSDVVDARRAAEEALARLESDLDSRLADTATADRLDLARGSRDAARDLLDDRRADLLDLVGVTVLAITGRTALIRREEPYRCCFIDPRHGRARHEAEIGGSLSVPVCRPCQRDLERDVQPAALLEHRRGRSRPYYEGESVWARTGYGALSDLLWDDVLRERAR